MKSVPHVKMVFIWIINFVNHVVYVTLTASTALCISVQHVRMAFIFSLEFANLVSESVLNVPVIMIAQNAIQV